MNGWQRFAAGLAALLVCTIPLQAALTGDIRGQVTDPQGLPVQNAQITIKNVDTGATRAEATGPAGDFSALLLDVGNYQIRVEKQGFRIYTLNNVVVRSGQIAKVAMTLQIGLINETVTVETGAETYLDAASPQVSNSYDAHTIQSLPLLNSSTSGRDPIAIADLSPGVVPVTRDNLGVTLLSGNFNANGQRGRSNNITVDNAVATDIVTTEQAGTGTFSLDSVQEITVITGGFSAEFGRNTGSQVQIITKGGGNEIHGTAYWFTQNSALNAKDFFDPPGKIAPFSMNVWGGTLGAPVIKNHLFVFGDYQGVHSSGASGGQAAAVLTTAQATAISDPTSLALFNAVGAPQSPSGVENSSAPNATKQYLFSLRVDEDFNGGKDLLTERYSTNPVTAVTPGLTYVTSTLPNYGASETALNHYLNVGYTHAFTPAVINQVRFQFARTGYGFEAYTSLSAPYAPVINISGLPPMGVSVDYPQSRLENIFQYGDVLSWATGRHALKFGVDVYQYQDTSVDDAFSRGEFFYGSLSAFQMGTLPQISYLQVFGKPERDLRDTDAFFFAQDDIRVTPTLTVNLGLRLESSGGVSEAHNVLANLDLNSQTPIGGGGSGPLGSIDLGGDAYGRNTNWAPRFGAAWNPNHGKLVLRGGYGWVYDFLFLNPIINQQFTVPYFVVLSYSGSAMSGSNSYPDFAAGTAAAQVAAQASVGSFPASEVNFGNILPVQQNLKNPRTAQWNAGVEYQVAKDFVVKATYIGSSSKFLQVSMPINLIPAQNRPAPATSIADEIARYPIFANTYAHETGTASGSVVNNRLDPRFNAVTQVQSIGNADYEGLQIQALKKISHGLSFQGSYTYGHSNDDVSDALSGIYGNDLSVPQNPSNLAANWGPSAFDARHRFVLNSLFEVPWTRRFTGVRDKVLDGWAVDGILIIQSGLPVSILSGPVLGISDVAVLGGGTDLANGNASAFTPAPSGSAAAAAIPAPCDRGILGATPTPGNPTCANVSGFPLTQPLLGTFGNSGRNQLRLDGLSNLDMAILKNTRVNEKLAVQFRWETYNVFNHTNFSGFVNTLTAPNFGTYTNTATDPRKMQFALKVLF